MNWLTRRLGGAESAGPTQSAETASGTVVPVTTRESSSESRPEPTQAEPTTAAAADAGETPVSDLQPVGDRAQSESIAQQLAALSAQQAQLNELVSSRLLSDEVQAKAVERLHEQLQEYKGNFIRQALLPILKDVIFCFDFVESETARLGAQDEPPSPEALAKMFEHVKHMLLDTLFKYDIEPFRSDDEHFDRKTQQCVKTISTDLESEDKKIAALGVRGFREGETIVRKEQVIVYKYSQTGR